MVSASAGAGAEAAVGPYRVPVDHGGLADFEDLQLENEHRAGGDVRAALAVSVCAAQAEVESGRWVGGRCVPFSV